MLLTLALMMISSISIAKYRPLPLTLHRLFDYKSTIHGNVRGTATNVYTRYTINTDRRNPILMSVPSMYVISKGNIFQKQQTNGIWNRYLLPFPVPDIITPKFVSALIIWATQCENAAGIKWNGNDVPV